MIRRFKATPLGWIPPELRLGFEEVASTSMDGGVGSRRLLLVEGLAEEGAIVMIPVEDLIADRMGQYASGSAPEMLGQGQLLFRLNPGLDIAYLERRIREETAGDLGIEDLR